MLEKKGAWGGQAHLYGICLDQNKLIFFLKKIIVLEKVGPLIVVGSGLLMVPVLDRGAR